MRKKFLILCLLFFGFVQLVFPDMVVIANPATPLSSLKKREVRDIFTGKKTRWKKGSAKIIIAVLEDSDLHRRFLRRYVKKTPSQFRNFWRKKVFTGEGKSPKTFKRETDLIKFVAKTKGAVGYSSSPGGKMVKIITIRNGNGGNK